MKPSFRQVVTNDGLTANGAATNLSSFNKNLDLFFVAGAARNMSEVDIAKMFVDAYKEDAETATRLMWYTADIREGLGERRVFKIMLYQYIALNFYDGEFEKGTAETTELFENIAFFSRWDVLFEYNVSSVRHFIFDVLTNKKEGYGLLAKWMPRIKSKSHTKTPFKENRNDFARAFIKQFKMTEKSYRKMVAEATKVVETQMSANQWEEITYSHVPSVAFKNYCKAFRRHDSERYEKFINKVNDGTEKLNFSVGYPHDVYRKHKEGGDKATIEAMWKSLKQKTINENVLPIVDVSGSMGTTVSGTKLTCMDISISLGVYLSEHNTGDMKDVVCTFSTTPAFVDLSECKTIGEKFDEIRRIDWAMTTDFIAVFVKLLEVAKAHDFTTADMPTKLIVISDMEFNEAANGVTNFTHVKTMFRDAGYELPTIVFWNVNGRIGNVPATKYDNVILLSGFTPNAIDAVVNGNYDVLTPINVMLSVLRKPRYDRGV
jgi:hypothetical protein